MESKVLFEMDTAWPFPILQYTANTSYVEVRKASGIAYILLQLISSSDNNSESLVATLKSLGIPNDIHYIFAGELANMINYGIIRMKSERNYSSELIDLYNVSDFEITDLGKKLFAEGTIPTGNDNTRRLNVYYDVSVKDTQHNSDLRLFKMENSSLEEKCIGDVELNNADVETFINENMDKYSFRKGERISGFEHQEREILVYKLDDAVRLIISQDGLSIRAKDKARDAFIHQFYTGSIVSRIIDAKKKYHFPEFIMSEVNDHNFNEFTNIEKFYMPSQFSIATSINSTLSLEGKCEIRGSECSLNGSEAIELMQECDVTGVACYFEQGNLYSIIPGRFLFENTGYEGNCMINLIAVQQIDKVVQQRLMSAIFLRCAESHSPFERIKIIKKLTCISQSSDYMEQFANAILKKSSSNTDKIDSLLKLNDEFSKEIKWGTYAKDCAGQLFDELCSEVNIGGFAAQNTLGKKLNRILKFNDIEYLTKISRNLVNNEDEVIVFEALEDADYSVDTILSIANVFDLYCKQIIEGERIVGNSKLSGQCTLLGQSLSELRELTGIDNPYEDSAMVDFSNERFSQVMATFSDCLKKLERYKAYAIEQFKVFGAFHERFIELKEVVAIETEATKNPKNINKNYIEQKLKKSKYKDAICDLHVRLQFELNRLFDSNSAPTFVLLSDPQITQYLDEHEVDAMHMLRKCRNGFQHPKGKRDVQYSEKAIREWCSVVEKLGGISNESRSEN